MNMNARLAAPSDSLDAVAEAIPEGLKCRSECPFHRVQVETYINLFDETTRRLFVVASENLGPPQKFLVD